MATEQPDDFEEPTLILAVEGETSLSTESSSLPTSTHSEGSNNGTNSSLYIIVGAVAAGVVVLVIIAVVITVCVFRSRKKRNEEKDTDCFESVAQYQDHAAIEEEKRQRKISAYSKETSSDSVDRRERKISKSKNDNCDSVDRRERKISESNNDNCDAVERHERKTSKSIKDSIDSLAKRVRKISKSQKDNPQIKHPPSWLTVKENEGHVRPALDTTIYKTDDPIYANQDVIQRYSNCSSVKRTSSSLTQTSMTTDVDSGIEMNRDSGTGIIKDSGSAINRDSGIGINGDTNIQRLSQQSGDIDFEQNDRRDSVSSDIISYYKDQNKPEPRPSIALLPDISEFGKTIKKLKNNKAGSFKNIPEDDESEESNNKKISVISSKSEADDGRQVGADTATIEKEQENPYVTAANINQPQKRYIADDIVTTEKEYENPYVTAASVNRPQKRHASPPPVASKPKNVSPRTKSDQEGHGKNINDILREHPLPQAHRTSVKSGRYVNVPEHDELEILGGTGDNMRF